MSPIARWTLLSRSPSLARSSHCLSITPSGRLFLYGGELLPRTPVDAIPTARGTVHSLDLSRNAIESVPLPDGLEWSSTSLKLLTDVNVPDPRVGAASVTIGEYLYVWGGRGGIDMSPLPGIQAGIWRLSLGAEDAEPTWDRIGATNEEDAPQIRSYHAMTRYENTIYVHAGCPEKGRTGELHAFDLTSNCWSTLASAPDPGRGGTALAAVQSNGRPVLLRFGGFAGEELDSFDVYDIRADAWRTVLPAPDPQYGSPGARAVYGFVPFASPRYPRSLALMYHGERSPSALGHAGAGQFWDDIWMIETGAEGEPEFAWKYVQMPTDKASPTPRGWFPSSSWENGQETKVVLYGGLLSSNDRSDELWLLEID